MTLLPFSHVDFSPSPEIGCYIDHQGVPSRRSGFIRWETKATSYANRGEHLLLFSPEFIEIRQILTGKLVQVIEGEAVRLLHTGFLPTDTSILVAMKGRSGDGVVADKIVELFETSEIKTPTTTDASSLWDEWDM